MANTLRFMDGTSDSSITFSPHIETHSVLFFLLGLFVITASLASVCVAQTPKPDDNPSPVLVLRNKHAEGMDERTLSPNGSLLATQHRNGVIKIWDAQSTSLLRLLKVPYLVQKPNSEFYGHHAFSPDGKHIASIWYEPVETPKETLLV
ncbi:MAG: hypothetical protein AAB401_22450, partial [Acidobacteriota bacterium]